MQGLTVDILICVYVMGQYPKSPKMNTDEINHFDLLKYTYFVPIVKYFLI